MKFITYLIIFAILLTGCMVNCPAQYHCVADVNADEPNHTTCTTLLNQDKNPHMPICYCSQNCSVVR